MAHGVIRVDPPHGTSNPKVLLNASAITQALARAAADNSARAACSAAGVEAPFPSHGLDAGATFVPATAVAAG